MRAAGAIQPFALRKNQFATRIRCLEVSFVKPNSMLSLARKDVRRWPASDQRHGKEPTREKVERKAEAGPPYGNTGILNEYMMKEIEDSVSGEGSHNQPKVLLEACHG